MSVEFLLTTLVVTLAPGTGVVYTLAAGLARGTRAGVVAAFGATLGVLPHALAAVTGLAALLHTSAVAFQVLKYAGVAYLLFMAWSTLRDTEALAVRPDAAPPSVMRVIVSGVLLNLLNPKLTVFFVAFLPQFVPAGSPGATVHMLQLSGVFMLATFLVFLGYAVLAARVRTHVVERPRVQHWLRRVFAGSFLALGARLAVTAR